MQETQHFNKILRSFVLSGDIILLSLLLWVFGSLWGNHSPFEFSMPLFRNMALMTLCCLVCNIRSGMILHRPVVHPEQIMLRAARNVIPFVLIILRLSCILHFGCVNLRQLGIFYIVLIIVTISYRLTFHYILELYRKSRENIRRVVLVGGHENIQKLYHSVTDDPTPGYYVQGCFEDLPLDRYPMNIVYLERPYEVAGYLIHNAGKADRLCCSPPSARSAEIMPIINHCENHLICFFSVPSVRNYLKRRTHFEMLGNIPVLSIRREPLELLKSRIVKHSSDIVCSLLSLYTLFPIIYIIMGLVTKISSPGPIFFKQK